ncbi:class II histone deacetylase [Natronorubrum sp. JWXQ-INN-674]|uniref:Class II histone deacetylase n=1 Tax=Natronorubrum halalkaliphilum TaxID=2691917 RepID=A0A6B0VFX6_9EURY|nr:class II histone deacetylase [Natronorubrum halalkaliphilum]MXV60681.1 class II histone deacetylase [Natronorubrum halalkaliphilum]
MASATAFWDESFLEHVPPAGEGEAEWTGRLAVEQPHPDRPERLRNVRSIVRHELADRVRWTQAPEITDEELHRVHDPDYVREFRAFCDSGGGRITGGTGANEASYRAARHAAGGAAAAATHALEHGLEDVPYAAVRPSGHHAQPAQADGFCFFNNAAVAAERALADDRVERVCILDWDVHHGNGTQEVFYGRDDVLTISLHNDHWSWNPDAHPQTGDVDERGTGPGEGYNLNVPLPPGTGDDGYAEAFDRLVEPVIEQYAPDLLVVSAGGDAGTVDPLGRNVVTKSGFESLGARARDIAATSASGRLVLLQEGGYHPSHLAYAMLGTLEGVLGIDSEIDDPFAWLDEDFESAADRIAEIREYYADWWTLE